MANLCTIIANKNSSVGDILKDLWNLNVKNAQCRIFNREDKLFIEIDEVINPISKDGGALGNFYKIE
jgi:hypothetical protein